MVDSETKRWRWLGAAANAHALLYRVTRGRIGQRFRDLPPMLLLEHTGARSGISRHTPLAYVRDGESFVVVASKGGYPRHPAWFHNLSAHPDVTVRVGARRIAVRAHVADPSERARLWPRAVEAYPGYAQYAQRTTREIPLVVLEPR